MGHPLGDPKSKIENPPKARGAKSKIPLLDYGLLLALLLPLFAVMPLLTHAGLPNTADGLAHLIRQIELNQAWQEGNFYPRWGTDLALGHGMPIFSYAPPALYQLTQVFHLVGLPLDESMKAVLVLDFLLYSLGMFLFARRVFGPYPALIAAVLYVYTPYRLREAYIQGNYGQFTGLAFYPFIFWAFHGLITTGQTRYLIAGAFSLAGLLFSHNISFMLFVPLFAAYLLFLLILTVYEIRQSEHEETKAASPTIHYPPSAIRHLLSAIFPGFWRVTAAGLLGLGLAAIFWLPAFGERHEIQLEGITRGFFDFHENFISLGEYFAPPLPLDLSAINPEFPLSLGLPQIIGAGVGLFVLLLVSVKLLQQRINKYSGGQSVSPLRDRPAYQRNDQPASNQILIPYPLTSTAHALFFAFWLGLYTFLALPLSEPLWEAVPFLELTEFPWRMLGPAIFCASLLGAFGFGIFKRPVLVHSRVSYVFSNFYFLIPLFLAIALNAYYLYPSQFIVWGTPTPADAFAYEVTSGAIGTTSTGEFLPSYAQQRPQPDTLWPDYAAGRPPQKIDPTAFPPSATVETLSHSSESDAFLINTSEQFTATIRTLYWPGWQVYLDGQPVAFTITPHTGLIQALVPSGQHSLTLQLESTPLRTTGQWLTILTFGILIVIAGLTIKKRFTLYALRFMSQREASPNPISHSTFHFFTLTAVLLIALYLLSRPLAPLFTLQSDPNQPQPADQVLQVDFGRNVDKKPLLRLVGMNKVPVAAQISDSDEAELTVTLYWHALQDVPTNYSVFLHLDAPNSQTFATVDEAHPENIPTRNWPPGLYLRNLLHLKIPPTLPPIRYDITVGWYDRQSGESLVVLPSEATTFKLGSIWLTPAQPHLPQTPLVHFGPHITLWKADYPADDNGSLALYWQTGQPLAQEYTIFVHLLDANGKLLDQADGAPYTGLYPLVNWQPGQVIIDSRPLASLLPSQPDLAAIAIGIYDPTTGERLPATNADGQPLPDNRFILPVTP
jgi:Ca2+/Na+ antiporter